MFSTTHDAILLIVAALYILTAAVRTVFGVAFYKKYGTLSSAGTLGVTTPLIIAALIAILAVIW